MRSVGAEVADDLVGMCGWVDLRIGCRNAAVLADYVRNALIQAQNRNPVIGAIGFCDFLVGIEQQWKRQPVLLRKRPVCVSSVDTTSEDKDSQVLQFGVAIAKGARLFGASGRIVFEIKIQDDYSWLV